MAFTGKATYSAGTSLPELTEDVSDLVGIVSPYETTLLDALGDPMYAATSTHHECLEDSLLPNKDAINDSTFSDAAADTTFAVDNGSRFQVGDQIQVEGSGELMLVTGISTNTLTVVRGYGATTPEELADNKVVNILGNAALKGGDKPTSRFTNRTRASNYTQIFTASVEVSSNDLTCGVSMADELDYQKQERLRELLRDLENTVINGGQSPDGPQDAVLKGIFQHITTNAIYTGDTGFPSGTALTKDKINYALRQIWGSSSGNVDLIVVNGHQKRKINEIMRMNRAFGVADERNSGLGSLYESDFGLCRVVVSRWMPKDAVLLLDSSRLAVLPLGGRSFHFKPLASGGDYECGQLIGEYTLEMRNEESHGYIRGLSTSD